MKHIGTSAIMDLLLRLLTCIEPPQPRQDVLNVSGGLHGTVPCQGWGGGCWNRERPGVLDGDPDVLPQAERGSVGVLLLGSLSSSRVWLWSRSEAVGATLSSDCPDHASWSLCVPLACRSRLLGCAFSLAHGQAHLRVELCPP